MEADEVFDNRHGSKQSGTDTEDGVGRQLVARQAIPHAKVEADGHEDAVEDDEGPEPEDGLLAGAQRVLERRRAGEVGVIVGDLGVGKLGVGIWRRDAAWLCAGVEAGRVVDGRGAARLSFVVAGAVDVHAGYGQRVGLSCSRRSRCISLGRQRPQGLRRRLLRSHCVERWHDGVPRRKVRERRETRRVGRVLSGCQRVRLCLDTVGVSWGNGRIMGERVC